MLNFRKSSFQEGKSINPPLGKIHKRGSNNLREEVYLERFKKICFSF
ncbi:hypothetical protein NEOC95_001816 [Neochlamydia sp. AcF95]|nr:hypothetical protein [Neochlamydia sp. AcF95]